MWLSVLHMLAHACSCKVLYTSARHTVRYLDNLATFSNCSILPTQTPLLLPQQHKWAGIVLRVSLQVGEHELIEALDVAVLGAEVSANMCYVI
jgi:hypothetical protein